MRPNAPEWHSPEFLSKEEEEEFNSQHIAMASSQPIYPNFVMDVELGSPRNVPMLQMNGLNWVVWRLLH